MNAAKANANIEATFKIEPTRSQSVLVAAAVGGIITIICSMGLFVFDRAYAGIAFLLFAAAIFFFTFRGWFKSQSDVDLEQSHPTSITLPNGTSLTTDSRTLRSLDSLQGAVRLCEEVIHRKPLPEPTGLVDGKLQAIPNSGDQARTIQAEINKTTQEATNLLIDALQLNKSENIPLFEQPTTELDAVHHEYPKQNLNVAATEQRSNT